MKIAIFTDSFAPGLGGTEFAVLNFAKALSENHQVIVFAPKYKQSFPDDKMPFKVVRAKSIKLTSTDYWAMPAITKQIKLTLDEFKPDVIHCQSVGMMVGYANAYAKKHDIPVIHTIHTNYKACYIHAFKSKLITWLLLKHVMKRTKKADCVCSVSNFMREQLKSYGVKNDVTVIRNGCNLRNVECERKETEKFELLFVGSLTLIKNIDFTLRALKELKLNRNDFVFNVIGKGPDEKKIKRLVKKLGLEENVNFVGAIRDINKLNEYYSSAGLFLFPSKIDTDGLVMLEAANCNTPSLVLANTGASERLKDGESGFVSDDSEPSYAKKILELMNDKQQLKRVSQNTKNIFSTWGQTASEYEKIYNDLLENKTK